MTGTRVVALAWFGLVACGGTRAGSTAPSADSAPGEIGAPCQNPGEGDSITILDANRQPIDMTSGTAIEAAAGQPVILCAPIRRALEGRVLDASTGAPIANATVLLESWQTVAPIGGRRPQRRLVLSGKTRTDPAGRWSIAPASQWMRGILAADGFPFVVTGYCVQASNYASFVFDPWAGVGRNFEELPREARLTPGNARPPLPDDRHSPCGVPFAPAL